MWTGHRPVGLASRSRTLGNRDGGGGQSSRLPGRDRLGCCPHMQSLVMRGSRSLSPGRRPWTKSNSDGSHSAREPGRARWRSAGR